MKLNDDITLGLLLGRRQALSMVAGRCSAGEAVHLKEIRDSKIYLQQSADWPSFCKDFLHMSDDSANRLIRLLEEFGPTYFDIAQMTRISPATYRAIAPSIQEQKLHHNGEAIALIAENADKIAAAVAEFRKTITVTAEPAAPVDPILTLEKRCDELVGEIEASGELADKKRMRSVICSLVVRLGRLLPAA